MGNGGSLCDALHFAVEFTHPIIEKRAAFPAIPLMTDIATMTAISNDTDYARVFVDQLRLLGQPGDMAMAVQYQRQIPQSDLCARRSARKGNAHGSLVGKDGGRFPEVADYSFIVPSLQHSSHSGSARYCCPCRLGFGPYCLGSRGCDLMDAPSLLTAACPVPITNYKEIVLAHGSGGKLSQQLIEKMILPHSATNCSNRCMTGPSSVGDHVSLLAPTPTLLAHLFSGWRYWPPGGPRHG